MNNKIYLVILFCCAVLCSCESMINDLDQDKLPKVGSRLAVECYISPQSDQIIVMVTESQPIFGPSDYNPIYIKNASVVLSGEAGQVTIPYKDSTNSYTIKADQFKIEPGKKYNLLVSDGKRTVKASCTVPVRAAKIKNYELQPLAESRYPGDSSVNVKMSWDDIKGETNYYVLRGYTEIEQKNLAYDPATGKGNLVNQRSKSLLNFSYENFLYTDTNIDGITFNSPVFNVLLYNYNFDYIDKEGKQQTTASDPVLKEVYFEILNMDENYYKFCKTIKDNGNSDNPFVEPELVFSNIEGGLGCFGAYNAGNLLIKQ